MKRSNNDYEVTAPSGERFVIGWAPPRHVYGTFGRGRWGVEVMRRNGPVAMEVVDIHQVDSESEGEAAIRDLAATIVAGRWQAPISGVGGARRVRGPRRAEPLFVFALVSAGLLVSGADAVVAVSGAIAAALMTAVVRRGWS